MNFPTNRLRRYRKNPYIRKSLEDISLQANNFIQPLFVHLGKDDQPIDSMPGISRISINNIGSELAKVKAADIPSVLVFPIPDESEKDEIGSCCTTKDGSPFKIIERMRQETDLNIMVDLCLCPFTDHGHCGIIENEKILNDATLEKLGLSALTLAQAGADWVAPSGMMDGMVQAIRSALDQNDFEDVAIMSYSIKFNSAFYGPFRDAAHSAPSFSDRKSYQMDFRSQKQILLELKQDISEGADAVMVKPALAYLDVIQTVRQNCDLPLAAYQVSGEYSMIREAHNKGLLKERDVFEELFYGLRRAGTDWIISYYATEFFGGGM